MECVSFEDLQVGATFHVKDVFTASGASATIRKFQWVNGQWTGGGFARVADAGNAGGSQNEIWVNNVNLGFSFGHPLCGLALSFGEYGGNINICINGDFRNINNFSDINKTTIGGVNVTVIPSAQPNRGRLELSGEMNEFALHEQGSYSLIIGGQELAIDDICPHILGIVEPLPDERFVKNERIRLRGLLANIPSINPYQVRWVSDQDGLLGYGIDLMVSGLSVGTHNLLVQGYGDQVDLKIRIFETTEELYKSPPSRGEVERIQRDFSLVLLDDNVSGEKWSSYDPDKFDQTSVDPTKMVAIAQLDILRRQRFSEPLPFTKGKTIYDHIKQYVHTINLSLECDFPSGGGGQITLGRSYHVWCSIGYDPDVPNWCKITPSDTSLFLWRVVPFIYVHEARHSEPDDPGHVACNGKTNMDQQLEGPGASGHAQAAIYLMWVYKYGLFESPYLTQYAKEAAKDILETRFCIKPTHSNPKVQAIIDELITV